MRASLAGYIHSDPGRAKVALYTPWRFGTLGKNPFLANNSSGSPAIQNSGNTPYCAPSDSRVSGKKC